MNEWDRQIAELKRKAEEKQRGLKKTIGRCSCGCARFSHKMRDGQLIRTCYKCKDEKAF